jgi:YfiH family protein
MAPETEASPTAFLARRFGDALDLRGMPMVRATQVHGNNVSIVEASPGSGQVLDAGECDVLATRLTRVGLVVQTADCIPILLAGERGIGAVHAGWRGTAANAAASGVAALVELGEDPADLHAWLGPSIGSCCYEVGGEVAAQFAGEFVRRECGGKFRLDLPGVNRSQLEAAGVPTRHILAHPSCTRCGGETYASYRRDGAKAGRMIALIARL